MDFFSVVRSSIVVLMGNRASILSMQMESIKISNVLLVNTDLLCHVIGWNRVKCNVLLANGWCFSVVCIRVFSFSVYSCCPLSTSFDVSHILWTKLSCR